jgi:hypothetical protein
MERLPTVPWPTAADAASHRGVSTSSLPAPVDWTMGHGHPHVDGDGATTYPCPVPVRP